MMAAGVIGSNAKDTVRTRVGRWAVASATKAHLQALHAANLVLQLFEPVVADIQSLQHSQAVQAEWQCCQAVVLQVQSLQLPVAAASRVRNSEQPGASS
jgi:hypothetical protein